MAYSSFQNVWIIIKFSSFFYPFSFYFLFLSENWVIYASIYIARTLSTSHPKLYKWSRFFFQTWVLFVIDTISHDSPRESGVRDSHPSFLSHSLRTGSLSYGHFSFSLSLSLSTEIQTGSCVVDNELCLSSPKHSILSTSNKTIQHQTSFKFTFVLLPSYYWFILW